VSIKSKYVLLNDTGVAVEFKQKGTPDPGDARYEAYGEGRRFAGPLSPSERWGAARGLGAVLGRAARGRAFEHAAVQAV
jgi:hypothetical protein